ncbi:MAG: CRISPR-associated endonuclease Cas3'', partial [Thermoguttaceae bacterium]|nr:CRISPR-associated endonuclease Cas3'' [Thermoguttaceae bacterium]
MDQTNKILTLDECLAKTRHDADGNIGPGVNVETHCLAAFEVARQLLKYYSHFCTASLWDPKKDLLAPLLHDVGKVSPRFQKKIYSAFQKELPESISGEDASGENHCVTSALILAQRYLDNLSRVAASHHGSFCSSKDQDLRSTQYGGKDWNELRNELIQKLIERSGLELDDISGEIWKKDLILGLTILADWLSSGMDLEPGQEPTPEICAEALGKAGFKPFKVQQDLTFSELFRGDNQPGFEPNDVQKTMLENIQPGGIYVLETEMGSGKTEAALALAYELLKSHRHAGVYFALPTQLTSNKIYDRFKPFLENILAPENGELKPLLLHSKAWLEKEIQNDEENGFQRKEYKADSWFSDRKRALLAPFAVGTIDQLLMAVINVRHSALRSLGAAGKVIILDEVHSYDAYTGSLIQTLVEDLRKWNCTVIILSATLTHKLRNQL